MLNRREFGKTVLGTLAVCGLPGGVSAAAVDSRIRGVRMGLQSACFTFSGMGLDDIVKTMVTVGLGEIDVMSEHVEAYLGAPGIQLPGTGRPGPWARGNTPPAAPAGAGGVGTPPAAGRGRAGGFGRGMDPAVRESLRKWRLDVPLDRYAAVARKFTDAGLKFFSYNLSFNDSFTDEEIEKGLLMTKALGTRIITASSPVSVFPRIKPLAEKHDVIVALHNHMNGPEDFAEVTALSRNFWINLDAGHFFAMGHDPVAYIREHHQRITNIHVKDRKKDQGREMPFGEGDTPLQEVLRLVRDRKYDFPVCIEYVGPDGPVAELTRCFDYCKAALRS